MLVAQEEKTIQHRAPPIMYLFPDGIKIGSRTLKSYRNTISGLVEIGQLSIEQCEAMIDGLPPHEKSHITATLRRCMLQAGESPDVHSWNWVMVLVVHTLQRYQGNQPAHSEEGRIRLWRGSTPVDLFEKIRIEKTAIGTLIAKPKPKKKKKK